MPDSINTLSYDASDLRKITAKVGYVSLVCLGFCLPLTLTGVTITLLLTLFCAIVGGEFQAHWRSLLKNPVFWGAMSLLVLLVISMSYSIAPWHSQIDAVSKYKKLLYLIFLMPLFCESRWQTAGVNAFIAAMLVTLLASF